MSDRPIRVAVDARCLNVTHLRGIGKAMLELITGTASSGAVEWHLLADRPDLPMHVPAAPGCHVELFSTRGYRFHAWEQWSLPRRTQQLGADLLHAPAIAVPWWQPVPTVVNILDVIPWLGQDAAWPAGPYRDRLLPAAFRRASAVVTISDQSRRDILARWPELKPKLHVVSLGVDQRYLEAEWDSQPPTVGGKAISGPYLLYLGGSEPRKRAMWAIQTWLGLNAGDVSLVCCGLEPGAHASLRAAVPPERQHQFIAAPYIGESDMPHLYMSAVAVLYPTLYEGFGLPVIEAHAAGTPVLFSDVGSLSELKGPAAVVLPPNELASWIGAVTDILHGSARDRRESSKAAREWAKGFSWKRYVNEMVSLYNRIATKRREPMGLSS